MASGPGDVLMVTLLAVLCYQRVPKDVYGRVLADTMTKIEKSNGCDAEYAHYASVPVLTALSATLTLAADVSMKPPLPPSGALASSVPETSTAPF